VLRDGRQSRLGFYKGVGYRRNQVISAVGCSWWCRMILSAKILHLTSDRKRCCQIVARNIIKWSM